MDRGEDGRRVMEAMVLADRNTGLRKTSEGAATLLK